MFVKLFTTQLNKLVSKRLCINSVYDDLTLIRHEHVSWSPSRLTAEIQRFLLSVVVSSNCSPLFWTNDGMRKNTWVFFFSLFLQKSTTMQTTISTTALFSSWFRLRFRDTNMADSNRCQAAGHMGENQE